MKEDKNQNHEERRRTVASACFVFVLVVIGVPLWWKTTEVYRVSLPYDRIAALQQPRVSVSARVTVLANDEPTADEVAGLLLEQRRDSDVLRLSVDRRVLPDELRRALTAAADEAAAADLVTSHYAADAPGHVYVVQRTRLNSAVWLGVERVVLFKDTDAGATLVRVLRDWIQQSASLSSALLARGGERVRMPPHSHYDVVLSVAPATEQYALDWPSNALQDYIGTFLDELSFLHNFTLKSQWLHMMELDFQAKKVGSHHVVSQDRLPHLLSPLEKRSGAHVTRHTPVHLLLYAVPCELSELHVQPHTDEAAQGPVSGFMSARWGGVVLASPNEASCSAEQPRPFAPDIPQVMGLFLAQLRELLGFNKLSQIEGATLMPLRSVLPRKWETDAVTNIRTLEQITSARLTLVSIAQLLDEIPNIVINDEVGASIHTAVLEVELALSSAATGDIRQAYGHSQKARLAAENAFTSPSLLALLYFPDDQKYAVYIPLFLPVMIPVLISLKNIIAWRRGGREKQKQD